MDFLIVNQLTTNFDSLSPNTMWKDILKIVYDDFKIDSDDACLLHKQLSQFRDALSETVEDLLLGDSDSVEMPGTKDQSESPEWIQQRWPRITASSAYRSHSFGKCLNRNGVNVTPKWDNFIKLKLWGKSFKATKHIDHG